MFGALLKIRMASLADLWVHGSRNRKKGSPLFRVLIGIFAGYVIGCMLLMFSMLFYSLLPLAEAGLGWLYFAFAGMMAFALCLIGSVFTAQQQLFASHDNDLLFSMPIPPAYILASRMAVLLVMNLLFELLVMLPAGVVWLTHQPANISGVICFAVSCLLLPLLNTAAASILGWLFTLLMNRVRNKSVITVACSLAFLGIYFYCFANLKGSLDFLLSNGATIAAAVQRALFPAWALGMAAADGNFAAMGGFASCCLVPFALVYWVLSRTLIRLATRNRGFSRIEYREKPLKTGSASVALLKKELFHFGANGMYIMNAALGSFFTLAAAVALALYRDLPVIAAASIPEIAPYLPAAATVMICLLESTNIISAPSVSLEGKNLWIVKVIPVSAATVLFSKVNCHLVIALPPAVLASFSIILVLRPSPMGIAAVLILPAVFTFFCALLGIVLNLHFPKFDYINDVAVVKQGISSILSMLAAMGAAVLPAMLYVLVLRPVISADLFLLLFAVALAACCAGMCRWINTCGVRRFAKL
ncbi:MAG: hypothetical protein ACOYJR_03125 [Acutalibacteraceae bacterium]